MTSDPRRIFLDPGQAYTNVDRTLERVTANLTDTVSLVDLFGDETGAAAFLQYGFGPAMAKYLAEQSVVVTNRTYESVLGRCAVGVPRHLRSCRAWRSRAGEPALRTVARVSRADARPLRS